MLTQDINYVYLTPYIDPLKCGICTWAFARDTIVSIIVEKYLCRLGTSSLFKTPAWPINVGSPAYITRCCRHPVLDLTHQSKLWKCLCNKRHHHVHILSIAGSLCITIHKCMDTDVQWCYILIYFNQITSDSCCLHVMKVKFNSKVTSLCMRTPGASPKEAMPFILICFPRSHDCPGAVSKIRTISFRMKQFVGNLWYQKNP